MTLAIPYATWSDYWQARQAAVTTRMRKAGFWTEDEACFIPLADRFEIMRAQHYQDRDLVVARDMRPDDLTRYGLTVPEGAIR